MPTQNNTLVSGGSNLSPISTMAALRAATWPSHQRLEKKLDIKSRFSSLDAYRSHLELMWGFCAPLEHTLERCLTVDALPDVDARRKAPLLLRDLIALGANAASLSSLARCRALPDCADAAAAFGCAYVLEGATLGGRTLLPMVRDRLALNAGHGAAFLASYGETVSSMWHTFGAALDQWCDGPQRTAHATAAAVETFDALSDWLCKSPA